MNVGAWSFVCFAYDGAQITFDLNGVAQSTPGVVYDCALTSLYIGSTSAAGTTTHGSFVGDVDEVTVWSTALSAADMASLWNGGAGCVVR